ncbi:hypothetical protein L541_0302 [Bordetella hinzii CA90 BAL1384]|nr:hypothetical protein L543_0280 [Bordetella hinzii L60]KCB26911.1 hypothetical protein L541_0302 [Bordetella hinzii CA90 BAL1384]
MVPAPPGVNPGAADCSQYEQNVLGTNTETPMTCLFLPEDRPWRPGRPPPPTTKPGAPAEARARAGPYGIAV